MRTPSPTDQVVVITGAAGRLGRRMAAAFAKHGAIIAAIDRAAEAIALPDRAEGDGYEIDMTDEQQVRDGFEAIVRAHGRPDTVVHTVGMWDGRPLLDTSLSDWHNVLDINLTSTFLCFREAARHMQEQGGQLIAIASGQGADRGMGEQGAYSASKAGVIRFVESISDEYGSQGITAHAIAPSFILFNDTEKKGVSASEVTRLAVYLSNPGVGAALNGTTIRVYGTYQ